MNKLQPLETSSQWWDYLHDRALQSAKEGRVHDVHFYVSEMRKLEALIRRIKRMELE